MSTATRSSSPPIVFSLARIRILIVGEHDDSWLSGVPVGEILAPDYTDEGKRVRNASSIICV